MITVSVYKDTEGKLTGFECSGHAGFAEAGSDIVCAAVSALVINTINSIDEFLHEPMRVKMDEDSGDIRCTFVNEPSEKAFLLLNSMFLGLREIEQNYGSKYIRLT